MKNSRGRVRKRRLMLKMASLLYGHEGYHLLGFRYLLIEGTATCVRESNSNVLDRILLRI